MKAALNVLLLTAALLKLVAGVEKCLLDSTSFQGELNWDKEAFGDSNELPGWKEQSFNQKNGDVWRVHFVCDIASSNPNNWLRLPFISRDEEANRLLIRLEYTIRECKKYPGEIRSCKETFQMLYVESDGLNRTAPDFSESNYKYLKTIAPNSEQFSGDENRAFGGRLTSSSANYVASSSSTHSTGDSSSSSSSSIFRTQVDLPLTTDKKGVYIVFRDQGACVSLLSIKIFYSLCPAQVYNLVHYPRTPTGSNLTDLIKKSGQCIQNAESKSTPYAYCQTNGNWFFVNSDDLCLCKPGYYYSSSSVQCMACPQGRYKPTASNQPECLQCPDYSYTSAYASTQCTCIDGYYRIDKNDFESPCLPYPPEPKNLTVYYLDQSTIKLRWNAMDNYDKNSVQYKLKCYKCVEGSHNNNRLVGDVNSSTSGGLNSRRNTNTMCVEKVECENFVEMTPKRDELFDNKVTVSSLDANTQYFFELYAQHVQSVFKTKTVDIMIRTLPALNELNVRNLTAYQFVDANQILVLWSDELAAGPLASSQSLKTNLNYKYASYEIRYWPLGNFDKANIIGIKAPASNFTFKNNNPGIISNNMYIFQIRGRTSRGWSAYSEPVQATKISSSSFYYLQTTSQNYNNSDGVFTNLVITKDPVAFEQQFASINLKSIGKEMSKSDGTAAVYVIVAVLSSIGFVLLCVFLLLMLARSGRFKSLSNFLSTSSTGSSTGPRKVNSAGSSSNSDCDSIDFAKQTAQMAYNQLSAACTTTSSASGGSSPMWPKTYIDPHTYEDPTKVVSLFARELAPSSIIIESVIGGGEFGDVCKGCLKQNPWTDTVVAIKTLKGAATEQNRCDFLTEASIMAQFNDPNVIRLEGVVTQSHPLMIVTEYMENGSLDTFLRLNESKLKLTQLLKMLRDVASGMRYLSEMNYIHRDLAARNILVNKELVCKVADFGLSREIDTDSYEYTTKGGKIPIRWTAPEACNFRKYSCASDVWSYGVLAWEVLSYGERPYWSWENKDVIRAIQEHYRLPPPPNCADCMYKLMLRCWQEDRNLRPKFGEIVFLLDEMLKFPDELRKQTKIRESLPINPRGPTKVQLTSTRQFLSRLGLEHYAVNFESIGLANLSKLFHLDTKDLGVLVIGGSPYETKKIADELKRIAETYTQSLNNQNSYTLFNNKTSGKLLTNEQTATLLQAHYLKQQQQQQHQQQSIFNLIRTNNNSTTNSLMSNDLLSFSTMPVTNLTNQTTNTNGFLV